jgi:ferredoxin
MNAAVYRRLRIAVGGAVLGFCALAFADIGDWIPAQVARAGLWQQFTPSLLGMMQEVGWMAAGAVAVVVLTLIFGRVYCAMLCPLGVLMDLSAWLARRTGKKRKLPYRPGCFRLRAGAVVVAVAGLLAGTAVPLGLLDPYSIFGKITAATLRPALGWSNHQISSIGVFRPVDVSPVAWITAGVALSLLMLVAVSSIFRGRLWCNTVCPVGAALGLISRHALLRLQIADTACAGCSMCERVCPAQCIDFRNHRIDHSRCVMCLDCVASCKRRGISLGTAGRQAIPKLLPDKTHDSRKSPLPSIGRRSFLGSAVTIPTTVLATDRFSANQLTQRNKRAVLPPGAKSLAHFRNRCTACHLCVANCPDQVLRPAIQEHGLAGFLQPYQDFSVAFCSYNCSNCSQICPTGAIQPLTVEERRGVCTGKARFFQDLCVVKTKGTSCGACNEHCPTQAVKMVPWKNNLTIPEVDPELCVGCGGCEFICPVRPDKAIIVEGLAIHERAKVVKLGQTNTVREMEEQFPF